MSALKARRIYLHALTPLHSGTGQAADIVDLPIAREKATNWPVVPASSLKGVLADNYQRKQSEESPEKGKEAREKLFGKPDQAGPVSFTDLRILCLPVRSFYGTFAWVSSPLVLNRDRRDAGAIGASMLTEQDYPDIETVRGEGDSRQTAHVPEGSKLAVLQDGRNRVFLEDLDFDAETPPEIRDIASKIAEEAGIDRNTFIQRFAVVSNAVFDFLCETATEVVARIALKEETKTVRTGGLWYEEAVPAEAIFTGWAVQTRPDASGVDSLPAEQTLQIGGNATVGRGLCRLVVVKP